MSHKYYDSGPAAAGRKVMLATTVYDCPDPSYVYAIQQSREALHGIGLQTAYLLLQGNCHVDDARNSVVHEFLLSDCTDLVFLDADVSWEPEHLTALCSYDRDVVGGVYPYRREFVNETGALPVSMIGGVYTPDEDGLLEAQGLPTGFLRIRRPVLEALAEGADKFWGRTDHRAPIPIVFERTYENGERYGGDIAFCAKWRAMGGRCYAATELRLGHVAKTVIRDSLAAWMRRQTGETLRHMVARIRAGEEDGHLFREALRYVDNPFAAIEDTMLLCARAARRADGPIIETGSGLTTVILAAAAPDQTVYCIEHDPLWAMHTERLVREAGVRVGLCMAPIRDGWYDLSAFPDLPERFALGLNDGPPRHLGDRMGFFSQLGERCEAIIVDDVDDRGYGEAVTAWCGENDRRIDFLEHRAAFIRRRDVDHKTS